MFVITATVVTPLPALMALSIITVQPPLVILGTAITTVRLWKIALIVVVLAPGPAARLVRTVNRPALLPVLLVRVAILTSLMAIL